MPGTAFGDESGAGLTALEARLIEKINNARQNPLKTALELGMNTDRILNDFPEMKDILINGLPPFEVNMMLVRAAKNHTGDMIENHYYSHECLDGRTFYDRFGENGYVYAKAGETLGMLSFLSYVDGNAAVDFIFENIFRDELNPDRDEKRNILDPDFKDMGVSVAFGTISLNGGAPFNSCIVTCDFATPADKEAMTGKMSSQLFNLINQARVKPLAVAMELGMDIDKILDEGSPELVGMLENGLFPLCNSDKLNIAAKLHAQDMFERYYYNTVNPDGKTVNDRMTEQEYFPVAASEILEWAVFDNNNIEEIIKDIFIKIFTKELHTEDDPDSHILLNSAYNDIGIGIELGFRETESGDRLIFVVAIDFGGEENSKPCVEGLVYEDNNINGLYDPGEESADIPVILAGPERYDLNSDAYGRFQCTPDGPGTYLAIVRKGDMVLVSRIGVYDKNAVIYFELNKGKLK